MSQNAIRGQISSAVRLLVQLVRLRDGSRRVVSISEITGMEGDIIQLQEIANFKRVGVEDDGTIIGEFKATGIRPSYLDELETMGIYLPADIFDPAKVQ